VRKASAPWQWCNVDVCPDAPRVAGSLDGFVDGEVGKDRVGSNLAATRSANFVDGDGDRRVAAIFGTAEGIVVAAKVRMWPVGE